MAPRLLGRCDVCGKRGYVALAKSVTLIVAMWLWTDLAKTILEGALWTNPRLGQARTEWTDGHARTAGFPLEPGPVANVQRNDQCWAPDPVYGIRHLPSTDAEYVIDATAAGWSTLTNVDDVVPPAHVMPLMRNGRLLGLEFVRIKPDSFWQQLGLKDGDVLRRINGYELESPLKALELSVKLRQCRWFDVELERQGTVVRKTYRVQ